MARGLDEIYRAQKHIIGPTSWERRPKDEYLRLVAPLEIEGEAVEGLRLGLMAHRGMPDRGVSFQVEYHPPGQSAKGGPICRIEWRPQGTHNNKGIGPPELRYKPQKGSHHHSFELNWAQSEARVRRGFLDIAVPIVDALSSFEEALAFAANEFRINGVSGVPIPPWEERLPW